jgi:DHA1 family bicyclomycin/chloramphenicol resistance-like MFS transporter
VTATRPILGGLAALGTLSIDMYLPAMPHIAAELGAGASQVQLTLTTFLVGTALGHLVLVRAATACGGGRCFSASRPTP